MRARYKTVIEKSKKNKIVVILSCVIMLMAMCFFVVSVFAEEEVDLFDGKTIVELDLFYGNIDIGTAEYTDPEDPEVPEVPEVEEDTTLNSISGYLNDEETISYELVEGILTITGTGDGTVDGDTEMPDFDITYDEETDTYTSTNLSPFYGNEYIERVEFVGNITYIGDYTFYNCPNLAGRLTITSTIEEIGDYAFSGSSYGNSPKFTIIYNDYDGAQTLGTDIFYSDDDVVYTTYEYSPDTTSTSTTYESGVHHYSTSTKGRGVYEVELANTAFATLMSNLGYIEIAGYTEPNALAQGTGTYTSAFPFFSGNGTIYPADSTSIYDIYIPYITVGNDKYYFISDTVFDMNYTPPSPTIYVWGSRLTKFVFTQNMVTTTSGTSGRYFYTGDSFISSSIFDLTLNAKSSGPYVYKDGLLQGEATREDDFEEAEVIPSADIPKVIEIGNTEPNVDLESISGYLTYTITYELNDGILTISGTGEMPDFDLVYDEEEGTYSSSSLSPFYGNEYIQRVVFEGKITKIGDYTFYNCPNLEGTLTIPETVSEIGDYAFSGNSYGNAPKLTVIVNEYESEQTLGDNIFYSLTDEENETYDYTTYDFGYEYKEVTSKNQYIAKSSLANSSDVRGLYSVQSGNTDFAEMMQEYAEYKEFEEYKKVSISANAYTFGNVGLTTTDLIYCPYYTNEEGIEIIFMPETAFDAGLIYEDGYALTDLYYWQSKQLTNDDYQSLDSSLDYGDNDITKLADSYAAKRWFIGGSFANTTYLKLLEALGVTIEDNVSYYEKEIEIATLALPQADVPEVTITGKEETDQETTTEVETEPTEPYWTFTNIYTYHDSTGAKITEEYDENTVFHITQTGYETTDTENLIKISGEIDVTVYLDGINIDVSSSDLQEVNTSDTYNGNRYGDAPILVENRGDTILVLADNTVNTVKANGNRAGVEKASASTNYDVKALVLEDWATIDQDAELSDGALVITSEDGYEAIKELEMIKVEEEIQYISTNGDGTMVTTKDYNAVGDDCLYPVYDDEFTTVTVYKYDYTKLTDDYTTENSGTLNAYGGSNGNANEGAGIGTRGATCYVAENNGQTKTTGMEVSVDLANLFIIGGTINATAYGTHAGAAAIGTGSGQATSSNTLEPAFGGSITNMNIYGGNITTTTYGAGAANIGGGFASNYVYLTIYGGTIDASSDMNLGNIFNDSTDDTNSGNMSTEFTDFTTTGSEETDSVIAESTVWYLDTDKLITIKRGAGIGGGGGGTRTAPVAGATVNIYGGDIEASSDVGAGIGTGGGGNNATGTDAIVNIYGGTIDATSSNGAAIGSGGAAGTGGGGEGTVNIYDGEITATIVARENEVNSDSNSNQTFEYLEGTGAAIGGAAGGTAGFGGDGVVTIEGGEVYANNEELGSGIGGGGSKLQDGGDAEVTIAGGTIYAFANDGTGIGGGATTAGDGGDAYIEITSGTVYAASNASTGIGGGVSVNGNGGNVSELIISDDTAKVFEGADATIFDEDDGFYDYEGKTDQEIIAEREYSTIIYATSIGGGNSSFADGGDIEDFTIYNGFIDIGNFTLPDEETEELITYTGSGRIGGGKVTGDNSTGEGGSIGTYDDAGEVASNLEIMGGFIRATSIGGGDVEGDNSEGDGGEIAGVRLHGGIIQVEQHIGGGNVTGDSSSGNGGSITNLYINEKGDTADEDTATQENYVNTLIYTGSIGGGNVTGDNSSGNGGDIVTIDVQYATFNVIGYTDDADTFQVGHIGGGNITGANATGNGGTVGVRADQYDFSDGVTVHCGVVNAYSIGGGSVTDETSTGTGGFANVIIEAGFTTVEENIGGGNSTQGEAGEGKVTVYGGTTIAGLIGSGFSLEYGYAEANIHFHGGSINSQVSNTVYTGGDEYSALLGDLIGGDTTEEQDKVYDHDITLADGTTLADAEALDDSDTTVDTDTTVTDVDEALDDEDTTTSITTEEEYLQDKTEVFLTRICYYNTDFQKYELFIKTFTASYLYNGETYIREFTMEDVVTGPNGYIYLWLPEGAIITGTDTVDYNTGNSIPYTGAIQSKSVDALKYNCSKNYYGVTFPYTTRVTFYSDEECTLEFSGKYAGIITTPYGATLEFWAQTELEEDFYDLLAYRSYVDDDNSEFLFLTAQDDSVPEDGYYHYILTITTNTEMLFQTIDENGDNRMAVDLSTVYAEITDNSVTANGFILGGDVEAEDTGSRGSIFLTSSGLPTANEISFTGSDDKTFYVTLDRMVADNDDSIITINSGTVELDFGEFDNSITANEKSDYPAIIVEDGATLNLEGSSTSSLTIMSEAEGVPAIGSSGTVNIVDNGFLDISSQDGTPEIVAESFSYTTSDLTGAFPIEYEPTIGTLLGYYNSSENRVRATDYDSYDIEDTETIFTATTCRVVPTSSTYNTINEETGESEFLINEDGELIFNNVQYEGESVQIEHVTVMRDGVYLALGEDYDYTVVNDDGETNITIFSDEVYGNLTVLVKFTGELLYDANNYKTEYNDKDQYFPFDLIDPVDNEIYEITSEDDKKTTYLTEVEISYASSSVPYIQGDDGLYYVENEDESLSLIDDDGFIVTGVAEDGTNILGEQVLVWNQYGADEEIAEFTMKNVGIRYIYVKVETQITVTDVGGNEETGEKITKYTTPYSFEITEGVNRWQSALTCVSVVVDQNLTYSSAATWGFNDDVLYTFSYYDPDEKLLQELPYTPTGETYTGQYITADTSEDEEANYLTNFPARYGIIATQPAGLVYAVGTIIDDVDVSGQEIVDDNGNPYYGVYVGEDDKIYYTKVTTGEDGVVTEEAEEIPNAVMNYAEIIHEIVLFDVQKTKVTVLDDKDLSQLDLREDVEILPNIYNIGSSREATILVDFQYAPRTDETLYIVTSELPDGTKITLLDITDYDPESPASDPDPAFYYYVIGEDYSVDNKYEGGDEEIVKCDDVEVYDETGELTTYTELTMIPSTIFKEMGTYDTVDYDESYWYYDELEEAKYATNRVRYQICIEFPEGIDEETKDYYTDTGDYYFELRQGIEEYLDYADVDKDYTGEEEFSNVEATIVDSGFVLVLEDEIGEPTLIVDQPVSNERETITTTVTTAIEGLTDQTLINELSDDVLAIQLYVESETAEGEKELVKFDFPTGTEITLDGVSASSVRGGFAVFTNLTGGEQEIEITGLEEYTYDLVFYLCTDVENESYPMADCTYKDSTRVETDITAVDDPIYSVYAEIDAESEFGQDDSRAIESETGATLTFDVLYAVENTPLEDDELTVTIQKKVNGVYIDVDKWETSDIAEILLTQADKYEEDGKTIVIEENLKDQQQITVTVPSGLELGTYRINFNLDYQTYPFNIIVY